MKRVLWATAAVVLGVAMLAGCAAGGGGATESAAGSVVFSGELSPETVLAENADYTTVNDDEWSEADAVDVKLSGTGATSDSNAVGTEDGIVTIAAAGVYRMSGDLDGALVVDAPEDALVVLILDGVDIANADGPAIEVRSADDVALSLAAGNDNSLSDAASYAEDSDANAAVYSDADLTISGGGSLAVTGNGNDGITSKDDLVILSGTLDVTAADDALRGKDVLAIEGGDLALTATGGDGLKSDKEDDATKDYILVSGGSIDVTSGDDGLQAQTDTVITGGVLDLAVADDGVKGEVIVSVGGGEIAVTESTEAMEAANIGIFDGTIDLTASDDGINASGNDDLAAAAAAAAGGDEDDADSATGDASTSEDANGGSVGMPGGMGGGMADTGERIEISGGSVTIDAEGDGIDSNGSISISGGTLLSLSAGGMEPAPEAGDQGWLIASARISAGQEVEIFNANEDTVTTFTSRKVASSVTYSAPEIQNGASYALNSGGSELATVTAGDGGEPDRGGGALPEGPMPPSGQMPSEMLGGEMPGEAPERP